MTTTQVIQVAISTVPIMAMGAGIYAALVRKIEHLQSSIQHLEEGSKLMHTELANMRQEVQELKETLAIQGIATKNGHLSITSNLRKNAQ